MRGRGLLMMVALAGLVSLLLGVGLLGGGRVQAVGRFQPPAASAPGGTGLRLNTARNLAEGVALAWASDAQLVDVSATWPRADGQAMLEGPRAWTLVFYSPQRSAVLYVAAGLGRARAVREARVHSPPAATEIPSGPIGPEEAAMIFLGRGGQSFLDEHPGATVHLRLEEGQQTRWVVLAIAPESDDHYALAIDATTGEVLIAADPSNGGGT